MITRTFDRIKAIITTAEGEKTEEFIGVPVSKVKAEINRKYPEKTGLKLDFVQEKRKMSEEDFVLHSTIVE